MLIKIRTTLSAPSIQMKCSLIKTGKYFIFVETQSVFSVSYRKKDSEFHYELETNNN